MFLSKLTLGSVLECASLRRDIASPYEMHRTISRAFPSRQDGGCGRVLFRLEPPAEDQPQVVLVQSDKPPDWHPLLAIPGYLRLCDSKSLDVSFRAGQRLRFRLRANPTVKRKIDDKSKRVGLRSHQEQAEWLERKASEGGFKPLDFTARRVLRTVSRNKAASHTHQSVDFEGILEVTDPEAFRQTLASGIGPAKGFGFGLLSVAPL